MWLPPSPMILFDILTLLIFSFKKFFGFDAKIF